MSMPLTSPQIIAGRLADRFGAINMFFTSFFLGGLSQIFIWTFAHSYGSVIAFSVIYGLMGCWFMGLLPVVCAQLFGLDDLATITGFMVLANSPGGSYPASACYSSLSHATVQVNSPAPRSAAWCFLPREEAGSRSRCIPDVRCCSGRRVCYTVRMLFIYSSLPSGD